MPSTTPRGYPYPLTSDNVNPPADFSALATAVDTDVAAVNAKIPLIQSGSLSAVFTSGGATNVSVGPTSFATAFSATPSIVLQVAQASGNAVGWKGLVTSQSSTQFTVRMDIVATATITLIVNWIAVGAF